MIWRAISAARSKRRRRHLFAFGTPFQNTREVARRLGELIFGECKRRLLSVQFLDGCLKLAL